KAEDIGTAIDFLNSLSAKDLRDIEPEIIADFYSDVIPEGTDRRTYLEYVMCPRVSNETLTPYMSYFRNAIPAAERERYATNPQQWIKWIEANIETAKSGYPKNIHTSPAKVYEHRKNIAPPSRDIFTVASLRSFGVPSYLDQVTMRPHYISPDNGRDVEIVFADASSDDAQASPKGHLNIGYTHTGRIDNPAYYTHFTLSSIENGVPRLLNFDEDATWKETFADGIDIDAGPTLLVSGQRMADGSVLARASFFNVKENAVTTHPLVIRQDTTAVQVIGSFNSENIYHDLNLDTDKSLLSTTGRGYYAIALIRPNHEPSTHILNDISAYASELEKWGGKLMLLFTDAENAARFNRNVFPGLPSNVVFGTDVDGKIATEMSQFGSDLPLVLIADTFNRVVFISEGYTINLGRTLLDTISKL
ncbi:MAG: transglutaminase domain-containing protein, partial [Muribaculaceae bacterium]|nr:transglutaminase domain-containing protein [Muribaculaceae bacterium]